MHRQGGTIIPQTHVQVVCGLYAEDMGERLKAFLATHRMLVIDTMATMLICLLWAITTIPPFLEDGLLLRWDADGWTRIWSILLTLPFALRRTKPHAAAIWFVVTVAVQLVFGPAFLFADAMALPMFYSAVVYDCRNRTRASDLRGTDGGGKL